MWVFLKLTSHQTRALCLLLTNQWSTRQTPSLFCVSFSTTLNIKQMHASYENMKGELDLAVGMVRESYLWAMDRFIFPFPRRVVGPASLQEIIRAFLI